MKIREVKKGELKEVIAAKVSLSENELNGIVDAFYDDSYEACDVNIKVTSSKDEVYKFIKTEESSMNKCCYPHWNLNTAKTWNIESNPYDTEGYINRDFEIHEDRTYAIFTAGEDVNQSHGNCSYEDCRCILIYVPNYIDTDESEFISQSIQELLSKELKDSEYKQDVIKFFTDLSSLCDDKKACELISEWFEIFR